MFAIIGLIPLWLAARRLTSEGLSWLVVGRCVSITRKRLTVKSSISASPRCTLRRSVRTRPPPRRLRLLQSRLLCFLTLVD